jgi:hypothetical protein
MLTLALAFAALLIGLTVRLLDGGDGRPGR